MPVRIGAGGAGIVTGRGITSTVYIENMKVLDEIAEAAGLTSRYLARDAALAALDLYATVEELLADEVKGKIHIEVAPAGNGEYLVEATVLKEPEVRRTAQNATVKIGVGGRVLRSERWKNYRVAPSITAYVAMKMHIAFDVGIPKVQARATDAVVAHVEEAFTQLGVKIDTRGLAHAPVGGIEYGGSFYGGGQFLPLP